jgi:hypothetical protein
MKSMMAVLLTGILLVSTSLVWAEDVYATKNGKRYHKTDCLLTKDKGAKPLSMEDASAKGLKPCNRCFGIAKVDVPVPQVNQATQ